MLPPAGQPAPAPGAAPGALSVSQAAALIDGVVRERLSESLRIIGEVSNFTERGHWYFAVKDGSAVLNCVMFQARARAAGFVPRSGQEVLLTGRVEFYKPQGKISIYVERLEPVGAGALEAALRALVAEVRALGWLDPERKRPLPTFPRAVAVVTSRTGAALQDVLDTFRRRCPAVGVSLVDVLVQGAQAAPSVAGAIRWLSANHAALGIDAVLVTRGGGSMEDLWAFNDRSVAEAIVHCPIPVVAAIGHETDTTLAELVADERCATPTQAAMRLSPDRAALAEQAELMEGRLRLAVRRAVGSLAELARTQSRRLRAGAAGDVLHRARRLEMLSGRLELCRPASVYAARRADLAHRASTLRTLAHERLACEDPSAKARDLLGCFRRRLTVERALLDSRLRQLELVGPTAVLRRGYSVTFDDRGGVVRSASAVRDGDALTTRLAEGEIRSVAGEAAPSASPVSPAPVPPPGRERTPAPIPAAAPAAAPPARRTRKAADDASQLGLF